MSGEGVRPIFQGLYFWFGMIGHIGGFFEVVVTYISLRVLDKTYSFTYLLNRLQGLYTNRFQ